MECLSLVIELLLMVAMGTVSLVTNPSPVDS